MKIEIDFGSGGDKSFPYRWFLYFLPIAFLAVALFLWWGPILQTLSPFALAFVFAYLLNPIIDFLSGENRTRFRMHRGFALGILFLSILIVITIVLGILVPKIAQESVDFAQKMRNEILPMLQERLKNKKDEWLPYTIPYADAAFWADLYEKNKEMLTFENFSKVLTYGFRGAGMVAEGAGGVWGWMSRTLGGVFSAGVYFSLVAVIMFYMLLDFSSFKKSCYGLVPEDYRPRFKRFMGEIDRSVGGFIRGQATVCAIVGTLVGISMALLGVPFAILIGLGTALFGFIPYLGPVMGLTPAVVLTILESMDPSNQGSSLAIDLLLVVGVFVLIQMAEGFLISPKVMAESVDVSPLVVMGSLMLGGAIAGVTGMVLAIPVYCVLRVLIREYRKELSSAAATS
ncbi:MAG: AI-2E family transporter [Candidatus Omnitrophica bacterium]|nr:AI-2E family transporter [Candidatus Omnitrophota bacterium]MCA9434732.1 AI-2E family transporter [Candidatus Omnitrophota bacterium]